MMTVGRYEKKMDKL